VRGLERDIEALKSEVRERDETIGDKEKRIYELKKKNQPGIFDVFKIIKLLMYKLKC